MCAHLRTHHTCNIRRDLQALRDGHEGVLEPAFADNSEPDAHVYDIYRIHKSAILTLLS